MSADNTFIIVTWNNEEQILTLLKSIIKFENNSKIIVVDNNSKDNTVNLIKSKFPLVEVIENKENLGFAKANNIGVQQSTTKYLTFLNPDTELISPIIDKLKKDVIKSRGLVGGKLINQDGSLQPSIFKFQTFSSILIEQFKLGKIMPEFLREKYAPEYSAHKKSMCVDWLVGAFYFTTKELYEKVGGFSEDYFLYAEDMDLCYKYHILKKEVYYDSEVIIKHLGGQSEKKDKTSSRSEKLITSFIIFAQKYGYSRNLNAFKLAYTFKLDLMKIFSICRIDVENNINRYKLILKKIEDLENDS